MSDEIMLVFGEDGVAREYDDTWDITIHCESEEEQKAVLEKLNNSNQEAKELSKNSPKLDKENGDLQPTCNEFATDVISRQAAIDDIKECAEAAHDNHEWDMEQGYLNAIECIEELPSPHPKIEERKEESAQNVPIEDLISRKAAIDALVKAIRKDPYYDSNEAINGLGVCDVRVILNDLPSAQPKQRWIPVSERLPEDGENVLVTYKTTDKIHPCQYHDDGSRNPWYSYIDQCRAHMNVVLAWMPLPKLYRAERITDDLQ